MGDVLSIRKGSKGPFGRRGGADGRANLKLRAIFRAELVLMAQSKRSTVAGDELLGDQLSAAAQPKRIEARCCSFAFIFPSVVRKYE